MTDEQRAKRLHHHMYETCEGIAEHAERIVRLEDENAKLRELVRDMWRNGMCECDRRGNCAECEYGYLDRMRELGVLDE